MALRVLLADESSTIKKVMQLALQDFGVEVRSVPVGLDVLAITKEFKPDIIFVDVLLSKRSGYEVCQDLKNDPITNHLPIILMWSSFMDVDAAKFNSSGANDRLEKPFDAEALRRLVTEFVVKTKSNDLSPFLQFPDMPEMQEESQKSATSQNANAAAKKSSSLFEEIAEKTLKIPLTEIEEDEVLEIDDVDFGEEFSQVPLHMNTSEKEKKVQSPLIDSWTQENISKIKVPAKNNDTNDIDSDFAKKYIIPQDDDHAGLANPKKNPPPAHKSFLEDPDNIDINDIHFEEIEEISSPRDFSQQTSTQIPLTSPPKKMDLAKVAAATAHHTQKLVSDHLRGSNIDPEAERILREEARSVLENIAWKLVPDIAERVVREEIQKLLREVEKSV